MKLFLEPVFLAALGVGAVWQTAPSRTFTGVITDSECSDGYHGRMRMGDTDAECVKACVEVHGATYVLYDGRSSYELTDQKAPVPFAAQKVMVTGTLDTKTKTITVEKIVTAK